MLKKFIFISFFTLYSGISFGNDCNPKYLKKNLQAKFFICLSNEKISHLEKFNNLYSWEETESCKKCLMEFSKIERANLNKTPKKSSIDKDKIENFTKKINSEFDPSPELIDAVEKKIDNNNEKSKKISSSKNLKNISSDDYYGAPPQQQFFSQLVQNTKNKIKTADNRAKIKLLWINASKELCSSNLFDAYGLKKDWVGYVDSILMSDDGRIRLEVEFDNFKNEAQDSDLNKKLEDVALELTESKGFFSKTKGSFVRFSGYFTPGKKSQNECLDGGLDANPELLDEGFTFKFTNIEKL